MRASYNGLTKRVRDVDTELLDPANFEQSDDAKIINSYTSTVHSLGHTAYPTNTEEGLRHLPKMNGPKVIGALIDVAINVFIAVTFFMRASSEYKQIKFMAQNINAVERMADHVGTVANDILELLAHGSSKLDDYVSYTEYVQGSYGFDPRFYIKDNLDQELFAANLDALIGFGFAL
jgi:hypothetical protein